MFFSYVKAAVSICDATKNVLVLYMFFSHFSFSMSCRKVIKCSKTFTFSLTVWHASTPLPLHLYVCFLFLWLSSALLLSVVISVSLDEPSSALSGLFLWLFLWLPSPYPLPNFSLFMLQQDHEHHVLIFPKITRFKTAILLRIFQESLHCLWGAVNLQTHLPWRAASVTTLQDCPSGSDY